MTGNLWLANLLAVTHFLWILFMLSGILVNLWGLLRNQKLLNWFWFRTLHMWGFLIVGAFSLLNILCPITTVENLLRSLDSAGSANSGSFISHYVNRFIYPELSPVLIKAATLVLAGFTIFLYLIRPPRRIQTENKPV
ncbi:MAG: DUF2784 domain-containing protein [candidate division Zixibacteria bacterium]|nr:DUF2784 domain-containing protein [candidate division Zixibacteria bacterium]